MGGNVGINRGGNRVVFAVVMLVVALILLLAPAALAGSLVPSSPVAVSGGAQAKGARPAIVKLSVSAARPGARLTITGLNFGAKRGKGSVRFGGFASTSYVRWSARKIVCKVPAIPAGKLTLIVRTARAASKGKRFTVKPLPTVVPDSTEVLSAATVAEATTGDGSTYSFADTSQTSALTSGDVIVGKPTTALPEGIFGKVTSVSGGGGTVSTAPATLDEVFKSAQFSADHPITQSDFTDASVAPGVRLMQSLVVRPDTRLLTFRLVDVGVSKSADIGADFGPVAVSGTITLKITVHVAGAVDWGGVKSFETSETTTVSSDLKASVTKELSFEAEKTLASWGAGQLAGFTVMVGPVPLYFQPELAIFVGVNGQFTAGAETAVHYEASGTIGLRYQAPAFSTWTHFSSNKSYTPPTLYASGSVKAYAGAQLGLKLYAAAGPYIRMDGYAQLAADTRETPWWTLKAGIEARVGAQIGVNLGFIHWNKDWNSGDLKLAEWKLAQAATPPESPLSPLLGDWEGTWNVDEVFTSDGPYGEPPYDPVATSIILHEWSSESGDYGTVTFNDSSFFDGRVSEVSLDGQAVKLTVIYDREDGAVGGYVTGTLTGDTIVGDFDEVSPPPPDVRHYRGPITLTRVAQ
jgi:hypothetical protein